MFSFHNFDHLTYQAGNHADEEMYGPSHGAFGGCFTTSLLPPQPKKDPRKKFVFASFLPYFCTPLQPPQPKKDPRRR